MLDPIRAPGPAPDHFVNAAVAVHGGRLLERFLSDCKGALAGIFAELCMDFFDRADGQLFLRACNARSNWEQREIFDAMVAVRTARPKAEPLLLHAILSSIDGLRCHASSRWAEPVVAPPPGATELALVDAVEFEGSLALSAVVARTEARFKVPLYALEQGIAVLLGTVREPIANPLGPAQLSQALADALCHLKLSTGQLEALYGIWGEVLMARLGEVYEVANRDLTKLGVAVTRSTRRAAADNRRVTGSPRARSGDGSDVETGSRASSSTASWADHGPASRGSTSRGVMVVEATRAILGLYEGLLQGATGWGGQSRGAVGPLDRKAGQHVGGGCNAYHHEAREMVGRLLSCIQSDATLDQGLRSQLQRLEFVFMRIAIADPGLFQGPVQPVQQIINGLGRVYARLPGAAELEPLLDRIMVGLMAEPHHDPARLQAVLEELHAAEAAQDHEYRGRVAALVEDCERQQAFLQSRPARSAGPHPLRHGGPLPVDGSLETARDWPLWLERARRLRVGDTITIEQSPAGARRLALAWIGADYSPYVFVDACGRKAASMTLQGLALELRRANAVIADSEISPFDRALQSVAVSLFHEVQAVAGPRVARVEAHRAPSVVQALPGPFDWSGWMGEVLMSRTPVLRARAVVELREEGATPGFFKILPCASCRGEELAFPYDESQTLSRVEELDRLVLGEGLRFLGRSPMHVSIAICLSAQSLMDGNFLDHALATLMRSSVPPVRLCFAINDPGTPAARRFVHTLRELGCRFWVRRLGHTDLEAARLRELPIDTFGIDPGFVAKLHCDREAYAAVQSAHEIARLFGKRSLAETTDDPAVEVALRAIGVDLMVRPALLPLHGLSG